ncbi:PREDICTED: FYN-binding protein [Pygoscelis adeliae]|uniref:FYN-binding protein n=1 Tax=Pygoscelis adeliae TaxID=9238 RepID=UPI0004F4E12A|nr:PREDICTED: FYN-binding protein [Pygoscelis adeliae]
MAKFNTGNSPTEDVSGNSRPFKVPGQTIHSGLQTRKAALEKFASQGNATSPSGPSTFHKPVHPKPPVGVKPSIDDKREKDPKPPYLKPMAQRFGVQLQATNRENDGKAGCTKPPTKTSDLAKEEPKPLYPKPAGNKFLNSALHEKEKNPLGTKPNSNFAPQESEAKPAFSKVAGVKEKFMSATQENEPKPPFSKPSLAQKPSLNHEVSHNKDPSNKNVFLQKGLSGPRPNIGSFKAAKEMDENSNCAAESAGSHFSNMALKPTGHWSSSSQGIPKNVEEKTEEKGMSAAKNIFLNKIIQEESGSSSKFCKTNTALAAGRPSGGSREKEDEDRSSGTPKRKALPPLFKLGQPPQKPSRPPSVDLERFGKSSPKGSPKNEGLKQIAPFSAALSPPVPPPHSAMQLPPPPPASHPSLQSPAAPSLPPRNTKPSSETISPDNEENYDDVEFVSQGKMGHGNTEGGQESDGEMYEDISDIRSSRGKEKKRDKEEKRRMDQEKKEQKEKEKKEQEIRKKFKLTGPIQVLHQARACVDHKGGKNELTVKQGDEIEIIRLTDNPEGKWLGRIKGCYGYIKTTMVEIDYDSLRRKQQPSTRVAVKHPESDQEVYDDVGEQDSISSQSGGQSGAGNMFPPPPSDQEIYDGIDDEDAVTRSVSQDEDKNGIWSWGILKRLKVKDDKKKSIREKTTKVNGAEDNGDLFISPSTKQFGKDCGDNDVYDDVDSSDFPHPPPEFNSSKSASLGKRKSDEKDAQKLKKMEKEEKEFRKKFKFEGEIKVLYSTTTIQDLPQSGWGPKDLQVKPGESLEIIESTDDTKVLCRNEEGKYGYVLRSNLVENDGEIYDDIGDDCIYDND